MLAAARRSCWRLYGRVCTVAVENMTKNGFDSVLTLVFQLFYRFLFGACCQLSGTSDAITDDYNKPLLNPIDTFNGNDNRVTISGGYGGSDTILIESSRPGLSTTEKNPIYLSSQSGQVYSSELPSHVTGSFDSTETSYITTTNKKKVTSNTKQPYHTKPTPSKYGNTDKYVLVHTLSHDKNDAATKPGGSISDNEINSIESIILMLNDSKTGPQYNTDGKPQTTFDYTNSYGGPSSSGNFFITTKLPASVARPTSYIPSTKRPAVYNVTYTTSHNTVSTIYTPSSTPSSIQTIFEKIPTITYNGIASTTKSPSTSYVYSTAIPKRPTSSVSNPNRISSTTTITKKPTKSSLSSSKKPIQKVTQRPISTSYVSGPTPSRPAGSSTKRPVLSSQTTPNYRPSHVNDAPLINQIGTSTPAPTVIVLGPYGIGTTENPSPTIHITPKPTASYIQSSTSWTAHPDLIKFTPPKIPSTSYVYSPIITKRPGDNQPSIYTPSGGTILNDFDDPGYYGVTSTTQRPLIANIQQTVTSASIYAVVDDNGIIGSATPSDDLYTSPNDLNNFPPVRNPNLNATSVSGATIEDYDISTPQFIEDDLLDDKMGLLVNKIVESLKDNFHDLADIVENKTLTKKPAAATTIQNRPITTLPTKKPPARLTTTTRRPSTLATRPISTNRPPNRRTTKKPPTTTVIVTKKPVNKVRSVKTHSNEQANVWMWIYFSSKLFFFYFSKGNINNKATSHQANEKATNHNRSTAIRRGD